MRHNEVRLLYEYIREGLVKGGETLRGDTMERGQFFSRKPLPRSLCCSSIFPPFQGLPVFSLSVFVFLFPKHQPPCLTKSQQQKACVIVFAI